MNKSRLVVRVLVVNADGKVLVLRRSKDDTHAPGRVDFPGGGVEPGETCEAAAIRELHEEAGLQVADTGIRLVYAFTKRSSDDEAVVIRQLYAAKITGQRVVLSHEHDSFSWQTPEEVGQAFKDISWGEAVRFVREHDLLP